MTTKKRTRPPYPDRSKVRSATVSIKVRPGDFESIRDALRELREEAERETSKARR